jgi:hypothetical protein
MQRAGRRVSCLRVAPRLFLDGRHWDTIRIPERGENLSCRGRSEVPGPEMRRYIVGGPKERSMPQRDSVN